MSVIAGYNPMGSTDTVYIATVKGAPEVLKSMFSNTPEKYDEVYLELSRRGARVLALGKSVGETSFFCTCNIYFFHFKIYLCSYRKLKVP